MKTSLKLLTFGAFVFIFVFSFGNIQAQQKVEQFKLDALINLSQFVDWYPANHTNKVLVIYAEEDIAVNYEINQKNKFKYKDWQVICSDNDNEIVDNSIVFVTNNKKSKTKEIIALSEDKNVLIVGDNIDNFCQKGGMINMIDEYGSISFEINYSEIQNRNIEISSKLLTLSKIL